MSTYQSAYQTSLRFAQAADASQAFDSQNWGKVSEKSDAVLAVAVPAVAVASTRTYSGARKSFLFYAPTSRVFSASRLNLILILLSSWSNREAVSYIYDIQRRVADVLHTVVTADNGIDRSIAIYRDNFHVLLRLFNRYKVKKKKKKRITIGDRRRQQGQTDVYIF